jgi:hypothetical protein
MRRLALASVAITLVVLGTIAAIKSTAPATPHLVTISIEDIHRQVDVRSLPVLDIADLK